MLPSRQSSQLTVANDQCAHTDTTILTLYHYLEPLNLVIYIRDFLQSVISQNSTRSYSLRDDTMLWRQHRCPVRPVLQHSLHNVIIITDERKVYLGASL